MTSAARPPRQRLDVETRRQAILAAASAAFASQPYPDVSVASIAADAEASEALVYRYFDTKPCLYAAVIQQSADQLAARKAAADAALPALAAARERVKSRLAVYLDHIADTDTGPVARLLLCGHDIPTAHEVRQRVRHAEIEDLRTILLPNQWVRQDYALWGYFGFLDAVCLRWLEQGCPPEQRYPLIDAVLGALEGALGDWGR